MTSQSLEYDMSNLHIPVDWDEKKQERLRLMYTLFQRNDAVMIHFLNQLGLLDGHKYLYALQQENENNKLRKKVRNLQLEKSQLEDRIVENFRDGGGMA